MHLSVTGEHQKVLAEALECPILIVKAALKFEKEKHCSCWPEPPKSTYVYIQQRMVVDSY